MGLTALPFSNMTCNVTNSQSACPRGARRSRRLPCLQTAPRPRGQKRQGLRQQHIRSAKVFSSPANTGTSTRQTRRAHRAKSRRQSAPASSSGNMSSQPRLQQGDRARSTWRRRVRWRARMDFKAVSSCLKTGTEWAYMGWVMGVVSVGSGNGAQ